MPVTYAAIAVRRIIIAGQGYSYGNYEADPRSSNGY